MGILTFAMERRSYVTYWEGLPGDMTPKTSFPRQESSSVPFERGQRFWVNSFTLYAVLQVFDSSRT